MSSRGRARQTGAAQHERFMRLALAEASRALGRTHPNPAVGAVIVKGGKVIAQGFHARAGTPHAEVVALRQAGARARGAALYSTLEPCDHWGRTPPCTQAILDAGITRVVYASSDPNPLVDGKGVGRLKQHGVEVVPHVLAGEADALNRPFFKFIATGLPWVTLKAGVTLDGKLATRTGSSKWITSPEARERAHRLRDRVDAVIVGRGTVAADDPQLTTRVPGGRTPVRVVLDPSLGSSPRAQVFRTGPGRATLVAALRGAPAAKVRALAKRGVEVLEVPGRGGRLDLRALLRALAKRGLLHVMVEGGAETHGRFLASGLVDELALFVAPKLFGHAGLTWSGGLDVRTADRALALEELRAEPVGPDLLLTARLRR